MNKILKHDCTTAGMRYSRWIPHYTSVVCTDKSLLAFVKAYKLRGDVSGLCNALLSVVDSLLLVDAHKSLWQQFKTEEILTNVQFLMPFLATLLFLLTLLIMPANFQLYLQKRQIYHNSSCHSWSNCKKNFKKTLPTLTASLLWFHNFHKLSLYHQLTLSYKSALDNLASNIQTQLESFH